MHRTAWKRVCFGACALMFAAAASLTLASRACAQTSGKRTEPPKAGAPAGQTSDEQRDQPMTQVMTPGPAHHQLARMAGDYTFTSKFLMPGAPATETAGTAKLEMQLDGRFLREENSGTMAGQPYRGLRYYGHNNATNKYEGMWTWTMSTALMFLSGSSSDGGKTIDWTATCDDETGVRQSLHIIMRRDGDDRFVIRIEGRDGGPTLEETYTRKK